MDRYSQRDSRWVNQQLGTVKGDTIGDYGCYVTSMAMMATYYRKQVNPGQLDAKFTSPVVLYSQGDLMNDDQLTKVYSDIIYQETYDYSNSPADVALLKTLVADPATCVILGVDFDHDLLDGIQHHFVLADHFDTAGHLWIDDPWTGTLVRFIDVYGDVPTFVQKYVVYKGPVNVPAPVLTLQQQVDQVKAELLSKDTDTLKVQKSSKILGI